MPFKKIVNGENNLSCNINVEHAKTQADLEEIADLKGKIFKKASYFEFYKERIQLAAIDPWFKPENVLFIRDKGRIVSHVTIFERPMHFGSAAFKMGGVGDVFTVPSFQGRGYSSHLMTYAIQYMEKQNCDLSLLFGRPGYYNRFGYVPALCDESLRLNKRLVDSSDSEYQIREYIENDSNEMLRLYQNNTGYGLWTVDRTIAYFKSRIPQCDHVLVLTDEQERVSGYICFKNTIDHKVTIIEAITRNFETSLAMIKKIQERTQGNESEIIIKMPRQFPFVRHILYQGAELRTRYFGDDDAKGMLLILNLCRIINRFKLLFDERLAVSSLHDWSGLLNIQCEMPVQLIFKKGKLISCCQLQSTSTAEMELNCDLRYFARNLIGYWSINDLLNQTNAKVSSFECIALLSVLFPKTCPSWLSLDSF